MILQPEAVQQFGSDWKIAPQDVKDFVIEIETLQTTLSITHTNISVNPEFKKAFKMNHLPKQWGPQVTSPRIPVLLLEFCRPRLEKLLRELQPNQWDRIQKALKADKLRNS